MVFAGLFTRSSNGRLEILNLIHFRAAASISPDIAMIDAATPASAIWQLIGGALVLWLHISAWHLLWWYLLGAILVQSLVNLLRRIL